MSELNEEGLPGLVARDRETLKKVFSSPLDVPREWKAWLRSWLEPELRSMVSGLIPAATDPFDEDMLPWLIDIGVFMTPISHVNWGGPAVVDTAGIYNALMQSSGAQNAEISFDVVLAAGTWTIQLLHAASTNRGIYSVQLDTVEKGTVDGYAAAPAVNTLSSVAGIVVATSGKTRLKLKMATKHASSSSYFGSIRHIQLRRTA